MLKRENRVTKEKSQEKVDRTLFFYMRGGGYDNGQGFAIGTGEGAGETR